MLAPLLAGLFLLGVWAGRVIYDKPAETPPVMQRIWCA